MVFLIWDVGIDWCGVRMRMCFAGTMKNLFALFIFELDFGFWNLKRYETASSKPREDIVLNRPSSDGKTRDEISFFVQIETIFRTKFFEKFILEIFFLVKRISPTLHWSFLHAHNVLSKRTCWNFEESLSATQTIDKKSRFYFLKKFVTGFDTKKVNSLSLYFILYSAEMKWTFFVFIEKKPKQTIFPTKFDESLARKFKFIFLHQSENGVSRAVQLKKFFQKNFQISCLKSCFYHFPLFNLVNWGKLVVPYKAMSLRWNRGVPMASRRGQSLLAVFYSTRVLPMRLAIASTRTLCFVAIIVFFFIIFHDQYFYDCRRYRRGSGQRHRPVSRHCAEAPPREPDPA